MNAEGIEGRLRDYNWLMAKRLRLMLGVALAAVAVGTGAAQTATVDSARLLKDLETLAADDMEGGLPARRARRQGARVHRQAFQGSGHQAYRRHRYERPFAFTRARAIQGDQRRRQHRRRHSRPPSARSSYLVVTAHYDHLGVRGGQVFNGADDNASGVAALLAMAARVSAETPEHSIVFAALDAEEAGLNGSKAFIGDPPIPLASIVMNVNLDMVARDAEEHALRHRARSNIRSSRLPEERGAAAGRAPPRPRRSTRKKTTGRSDSDHFPFHEAGIPFIYFGVEDEAQHHKATDDAETVTKEFFVGAANTILASLRALDKNLDAIAKQR